MTKMTEIIEKEDARFQCKKGTLKKIVYLFAAKDFDRGLSGIGFSIDMI